MSFSSSSFPPYFPGGMKGTKSLGFFVGFFSNSLIQSLPTLGQKNDSCWAVGCVQSWHRILLFLRGSWCSLGRAGQLAIYKVRHWVLVKCCWQSKKVGTADISLMSLNKTRWVPCGCLPGQWAEKNRKSGFGF